MAPGRIAGIVVLGGVLLAATASTGSPLPRPYTVAASGACLKRLPNAIAGLPPANPPVQPAPFVYSFPPDRFPPQVQGKLGVWYGHKGAREYEGITLSFFKTTQDARTSLRSLVWLYGGRLVRNVVVAWDQDSVPRSGFQRMVLGCLRAIPPGGRATAPERSTPQASVATFAGYWGGHTRGLRITPRGRALERTNDGCCVRAYEMTFQILSVNGTLTRATAVYRVRSFNRYERLVPRLRPGRIGRLVLRNGIVTNDLTKVHFCSSPAWSATGACGA